MVKSSYLNVTLGSIMKKKSIVLICLFLFQRSLTRSKTRHHWDRHVAWSACQPSQYCERFPAGLSLFPIFGQRWFWLKSKVLDVLSLLWYLIKSLYYFRKPQGCQYILILKSLLVRERIDWRRTLIYIFGRKKSWFIVECFFLQLTWCKKSNTNKLS